MEGRTTTRSSADLISKHNAKNKNSQKEVSTKQKQLGVNKRQRAYVANHNARAIAGVSVLNRTRLHATSPTSEPTPLPTAPTPMPSVANSGGLNSNVPIPGHADESTTEHADHMNVEIEHDHINMNVEMTVNDASTSIGVQSLGLTELPKKNVRGKTRGLNVDKAQMQFGGKLPITIVKNEGRPTGTYAEMFASEIGFVIRNHAPLNVEKWSHVSDQIKENLVKKLNTKFEFDMKQKLVKRFVYTTFGKRFTNFRNKLHKYFEEFQTLEAALQKKHKDVKTDEEWKFLCNYFSSEAFKKKSQTNSQNRANLKLHHKTGSRSFQSHQKHVVGPKTGLPLGAIDYFERQYSSTKKGWDDGAKPLWEEMVQMRSDTTLEDGTRSMTDDEICKQVLGEKSGYVKGCGFGPQPPPKYSSQASTEEMNERNQELQEKLDDTQQIVKSQADEIIALQDKAKKFEEFMAKFNTGQEATQQEATQLDG